MAAAARLFVIFALWNAAILAHTTPVAEASSGRRTGPVQVVGHSLRDRDGPFLGIGVSYFTALWRFRYDRPRLESELRFLSRCGFNYYRMLSMVGWNPAWRGLEIAPIDFTTRDGRRIAAWPDYWRQLGDLIDLAYDRFGLRTQITIFADAQLMPRKEDRIAHMQRLLTDVVAGREQKIILLEVANEAWQNGFAGPDGVADLRELTRMLSERTAVPVATSSNHEASFASLYRDSAADIATWHFSRDRQAEEGWKPVTDCWALGDLAGMPPVSSNEPIGPGSSVASEQDRTRLVMAAAFAYIAKLPMFVFHCEAGVMGRTRFQDTPAIGRFRGLVGILPNDLPAWARFDARDPQSPFTIYAGGIANATTLERPSSRDGCVRMVGTRRGNQFVCAIVGIRPGGLMLEAKTDLHFRVVDPATAKSTGVCRMRPGEQRTLPQGPGAWILIGRVD